MIQSILLVLVVGTGPWAGATAASWRQFTDSNAVPDCGDTCTSLPKEVCVGTLASAADCAATCMNSTIDSTSPPCEVWTFSSRTGHCWHRLDTTWNPIRAEGVTSGCLSTVPGCGFNVTTTVLGKVHPYSPAVALDWWVPEDHKYGYQWGNASVTLLDLSNSNLRALAQALSPAVLRLGGSPSDGIEYLNPACERGQGTAGGSAKFSCSQTGKATYACLSLERWTALLNFAADTGLKVAFGLNACNGRLKRDGPIDFTNIQLLLNATANLPDKALSALYAFEFGNEILSFGTTGAQWALDANELAYRINTTFALAQKPVPILVGPDDYSQAHYPDVFKNLKPGALQAVTYHQYPQCLPDIAGGYVLNPDCLSKTGAPAVSETVRSLAEAYGAELWSGEGADHTATGGDFGHDFLPTFVSSFYYAYKIGAIAANNITLGARQCLIGGNYGLLNKTTFEPNPDFFIAWAYRSVFKAHLGGAASALKVTGAPSGMPTFAFGATDTKAGNKSILVVAINLQLKQVEEVDLTNICGTPLTEWHFVGAQSVFSTNILVNGKAPWSQAGLEEFQDLAQSTVETKVSVAPASIAFVLCQRV